MKNKSLIIIIIILLILTLITSILIFNQNSTKTESQSFNTTGTKNTLIVEDLSSDESVFNEIDEVLNSLE